MKTRMQPIGNVWNKLPRVVRDLALRLRQAGAASRWRASETELDKTIIEAIKDPLTHLVRNAVDHGIETPERAHRRRQAGRGPLCAARLPRGRPGQHRDHRRRRRHRPRARSRQGARARPRSPPSRPRRMSERELLQPDLPARLLDRRRRSPTSPAAASAWTSSRPTSRRSAAPSTCRASRGKGTTLKIKIPLTLAIIPALIVTSGGDRYAIPQVSLLELVRLEGEQARARHRDASTARRSTACAATCCRWSTSTASCGSTPSSARATTRSTSSCCRPTTGSSAWSSTRSTTPRRSSSSRSASSSRASPLFAGATIMGDGRVALILDVPRASRSTRASWSRSTSRARRTGRCAVADERSAAPDAAAVPHRRRRPHGDPAVAGRAARGVPALEPSSGPGRTRSVQYRGADHAAGRALDLLGAPAASRRLPATGGRPPATRCRSSSIRNKARSVGLVVDEILDIVEDTSPTRRPPAPRRRRSATAVIQQPGHRAARRRRRCSARAAARGSWT